MDQPEASSPLSAPAGPPARCAAACSVAPSPGERGAGAPCWGGGAETSETFRHAIRTFLASGCCVVPAGALPQDFTRRCLKRATHDRQFLEAQLEERRAEIMPSSSSSPLDSSSSLGSSSSLNSSSSSSNSSSSSLNSSSRSSNVRS